jgi:hypothetical protein
VTSGGAGSVRAVARDGRGAGAASGGGLAPGGGGGAPRSS